MSSDFAINGYVPSTFHPGITAASYFASLCGCLLTVEILHRRGTALYNWRSWFETLSCATSMGLVGIWCMHFIGNRAIILGNGDPQIQLVYNSGFTVLSVVLPIAGLVVAFSAAELPVASALLHWSLLTCTGIFAGLSIIGMHYLGNFGVTNYKMHYSPRFLAAALIIAIGDCFIVLALFYNLREKWISAWWKRIMCAMALAGGVSAMHFTASTSCSYQLKSYNSGNEIRSRNVQVIVASVMCGTAALMVITYLYLARSRNEMMKTRAQKVVVACATFDPAGRVLVTTDGTLPSREITDKYNHRTFDDDFDTAHTVFQWIFRVTHNWAGVKEMIPRMKSHLHAQVESTEDSHPTSSRSSAVYDATTYSNYELLFEERFCTAAASMAHGLHIPIEQLGVLYDRVIETSTIKVEDKTAKRNTSAEERSPKEVEAALRQSLFGKGQLLFIVREASQDEHDKLLNAGYKFAAAHQVTRSISNSLQIPTTAVESHLVELKRYLDNLQHTYKPGTWLSMFAMVPKPNHKGFDIVAKKDSQEQLPDVQLLPGQPTSWQVSFLEKYDGWRLASILVALDDRGNKTRLAPHELEFAVSFRKAIGTLMLPFPPEWSRDAKFWSGQVFAHYSRPLQARSAVTTLYSFTIISDMHVSFSGSDSFVRVPKPFFDARHRCYAGSPDHSIMATEIKKSFEPLFAKRHSGRHPKKLSIALTGDTNPIKRLMKSHSAGQSSSRGSSIDHSDEHSSMHELVDKPMHLADPLRSNENLRVNDWGGILVNSETVIKSDSKNDIANDSLNAGVAMGFTSACSTAKPETTFVDELVTNTRQRFHPAMKSGM